MTTTAHQLTAEFFKTLGHPLRLRILELVSAGEPSVGEMLTALDVEAPNLSQQLGVLRASGLVVARREASAVRYAVTTPEIAELLALARRIRTKLLSDQLDQMRDVTAAPEPGTDLTDEPDSAAGSGAGAGAGVETTGPASA